MSRTRNDDRSDSKNPNNPAYWASEANRQHQTSGDDDDDDAGVARASLHAQGVDTIMSRSAAPKPPAEERVVSLGSVTLDWPQPGVRELYLVYLAEKGQRERSIRVDSPSIDEAIRDALVLWERGGIAFMALHDRQSVYLEKARHNPHAMDVTSELAVLGDLQLMARTADKHLNVARASLDKCMGTSDSHAVAMTIKEFGAWKAARDALHEELVQKIRSLAERGVDVNQDSLQEHARAAKLNQLAEASAGSVRDFQQGKIKTDPIVEVFRQPEKISAIRL